MAVFCEIDGRDNPITPDRGSAFALLPTGVISPLGLHVQADWLLVVTRREIMQIKGNEWHEEILKQLPSLIRYYLEWLVGARDRFDGEWHQGMMRCPAHLCTMCCPIVVRQQRLFKRTPSRAKACPFCPQTYRGRRINHVSVSESWALPAEAFCARV